MLFNSFEFLFFFLPITFFAFFFSARKFGNEVAIASLVVCSLFFYGWWNPNYLIILIFSMLFNYYLGKKIVQYKSKALLIFGISINLLLIAYYKYANFLVINIGLLTDQTYDIGNIILPLAISFFTFQQIAYLVDSYKGITKEYSFLHYALFVSFFPQLIAGPIVHHKDMLPQFSSKKAYEINSSDIAIGLSIFSIGLFKKTVLADGVAQYATPVFLLADTGQSIDFFTAWGGALAYTFQLYFDFSGYSDMAIGLARIFGIILPLNFYSPYKAVNISEFWRRWHITLSTFLRDYIYIPLGGNRKGSFKRYTNLSITMLLGGLWHGAGWNFIIWGGLHGLYLVTHQLWQNFFYNFKLPSVIAWLITFIAVVVGWVFFRATTYDGALVMLNGMLGINGVSIPNAIMSRLGGFSELLQSVGIYASNEGGSSFILTWLWIAILFPIAIMFPNVQDLFSKVSGSLSAISYQKKNSFWIGFHLINNIHWVTNKKWAVLSGILLAFGLLTLFQVSEFLYFQF